jgi:hypothetical protein
VLTTVLLFSTTLFGQEGFADTKIHNVFVTTGAQQLGPASIEIKYDVSFELNRPSSAQPNDSITVEITPKTGKLSLTIDVAGNTHTIDKDLPFGSDVSIDVAPGIEVYVSTSASSLANISGPVDNNEQNVFWSDSSTQRLQFSVSNTAKQGDSINLTIPVSIDLNAGLNLDLILLKQNLGQVRLGSFAAQPIIEETIPVGIALGNEFIIIGILVGAAIGGVVFFYLRKKPKTKQTLACKKCGKTLPLSAKFCAKCGQKV